MLDARRFPHSYGEMHPMTVVQMFGAVMISTLLGAVGCETVENVRNDPTNQRREITASAYSLDGCQEKWMNWLEDMSR